jgi:hypothetical protein
LAGAVDRFITALQRTSEAVQAPEMQASPYTRPQGPSPRAVATRSPDAQTHVIPPASAPRPSVEVQSLAAVCIFTRPMAAGVASRVLVHPSGFGLGPHNADALTFIACQGEVGDTAGFRTARGHQLTVRL